MKDFWKLEIGDKVGLTKRLRFPDCLDTLQVIQVTGIKTTNTSVVLYLESSEVQSVKIHEPFIRCHYISDPGPFLGWLLLSDPLKILRLSDFTDILKDGTDEEQLWRIGRYRELTEDE